jgi:hypothetical protein
MAIYFTSRRAIVCPLLIAAFGKLNKVNELKLHKKKILRAVKRSKEKKRKRNTSESERRAACVCWKWLRKMLSFFFRVEDEMLSEM